jgi:hypothetical protein
MPSNARYVIFLDIDGVLLPFPKNTNSKDDDDNPHSLFPKKTLQALQRLHEATTTTPPNNTDTHKNANANANDNNPQWILSSTWRVREDYIQDIEGALHEFGMDITFADITDPTLHSERQWEIHEWLQQQQSQEGNHRIVWLALDDEELIEGDTNAKHRIVFEGHVVKTESSVGLTMQDVDLALELWKKQL